MLLYLFVCACATLASAQNGPQVNTTQGTVVGYTASDGTYYVFYGLHYAGSTSNANRFKAPTPAPVYPGLFSAIDNSVICAQPGPNGLVGVEDCLVLNIYTSNVNTLKPVLVWLQSEEFTTTDNNIHSFKTLVEAGFVVVKLNYRLSIFGFLCLGVNEAPGNAGLKDVIQGLQWVQNNIVGFGGNRDNVMLFGHGSGAAIVDLITMSPLAEGLVHKAFSQSGSALSPWAIAYNPIQNAQAVGDKLGYGGKSRADLAQHFATTDIHVLINALNGFDLWNNTILFPPCIENRNLNYSLLTDAPINILRSGNYSHIPYIASYVTREGTLRAPQAQTWVPRMDSHFEDFLQADLQFSSTANKTSVATAIRQFYFAQDAINMGSIEDYLDYHGDTLILVSVIRGVRERVLTSRADVRLLEFAYRGTRNSDWLFPNIQLTGVRYGEILKYFHKYDLRSQTDDNVANSLVNRLMAFALNGNPNPTNSTQWLSIATETSLTYLRYSGSELQPGIFVAAEETVVNPHTTRMTFWNNIYASHYVAPTTVTSGGTIVTSFTFTILLCLTLVRTF